jgi:hypothetical protein
MLLSFKKRNRSFLNGKGILSNTRLQLLGVWIDDAPCVGGV